MDLITCPSSKQINEYLRGEIEGPLASQLAAHIKGCSRCLRTVAQPETGSLAPHLPLGGGSGTMAVTDGSLASNWSSPLSDGVETYSLSFLAPAIGPDELGWLANYRVFKVLGEGGMGLVLQAEDAHLSRPVAIKVMKPDLYGHEESRQRFMREARAMAQVKSDNVVTVHQVGEFNDICFIAMELLEGEPLNSLIERTTKPPLQQTLRIGREIAQALMAAHSKTLIHRDIKPENVWLEGPTGRVKLLDFGLARPQEISDKLTMTGMIMGTPSYMSPEQAHARDCDERSDLFSLGSLLYQLTSGQKPFSAPTVLATMIALVEHTPLPPSYYSPDTPPALDELILRLMAKAPEDRVQSAAEVIARIIEIERTLPHLDEHLPEDVKNKLGSSTGSFPGVGSLTGSNTLTQGPREAERRQLSVLVCSCDLFDSDEYAELEVEDQSTVLSAFKDCCRDVVLRHGGTIVQCNEEYLLACFGFPTAFEDATSQAARCALALVTALAEVEENLPATIALKLYARTGVHTGTAIVEKKGSEISLVGDARKVALRVADIAAVGQVVCSEGAQELLRNKFECEDLGQQKIRGISQPISLFAVKSEHRRHSIVAEGDRQSSASADSLPIGRDLELTMMRDRWQKALDGMGQVVLLVGEAGLGKSQIVKTIKQEILAESNKRDDVSGQFGEGEELIVIEWFCSSHFRHTSLHPISKFFEHLLKFESGDSPAVKYDRLVRHLHEYDMAQPDVVPVFAALLALPPNHKFPSLALTPVREREEMFRVLKEWLRACAARHPILFVIEDLHWLDDSTLQFLEQFLAESENIDDKIMTVLTFRPEFRTPWPTLAHQTSISLNRLTKQQASELVRKRAGCELPSTVIAQICDRAGGVPLFIEEITRMLKESGVLEKESADGQTPSHNDGKGFKTLMGRAIPSSLQDLIMARLDRLEGDQELAQLAAALGREFSYELILAVSGLDTFSLQPQMHKLVQGEILVEKGRPPKSVYSFRHALLQDALYNSLVKTKRRQFHQRIAEALEARHKKSGEYMAEILAHHFSEAGMIEQSIPYWLSAGLRSQEQCANVEAISHFTTGLELLATLPPSPKRDTSELLFLNPLGAVYQAALGYSAAEVGPTFARARELSQLTDQPSQFFGIMWGNWTWHLVRGDLTLCMELAEEMMSFAADTGDKGMLMEAHVAPAVTLFYRGEFAGCRKYCLEAISNFEDMEQCRIWSARTGQNAAIVVRCYLAQALWHLGYPDQATKTCEDMLTMARKCDHKFSLGHALHFASWYYQLCRMGERVIACAEEQVQLAAQQGFALWNASGTFLKGAGLALIGEPKQGLPLMQFGLQAFRSVNAALTVPAQLAALASAQIKLGQLESARQLLDEGLALADKHADRYHESELHRLRGELLLAYGKDSSDVLVAAENCFKKAIEIARSQESKAWELRATIELAKLWIAQDRHEEARRELGIIYSNFHEGATMPDVILATDLLISCKK